MTSLPFAGKGNNSPIMIHGTLLLGKYKTTNPTRIIRLQKYGTHTKYTSRSNEHSYSLTHPQLDQFYSNHN